MSKKKKENIIMKPFGCCFRGCEELQYYSPSLFGAEKKSERGKLTDKK